MGHTRPRTTLVVLALVTAGCLGGNGNAEPSTTAATDTPTATEEPTATPPTPLESSLWELVRADDRAAVAEREGLTLDGDRVSVVVELREGATLPAEFDVSVRARADSRVQAAVRVDDLVALARHENTTAVGTQDRVRPQATEIGSRPR